MNVVGSDFEPNYPVLVVECPTGSSPYDSSCGFTQPTFVVPDDSGAFTLDLTVNRVIYGATDTVDCAVAGACEIITFELVDGYASVRVPIQFDPSVPLPPPPAISIDPATGVLDGQLITVTGTNYPRGTAVGVVQCQTGASGAEGCDLSNLGQALPEADGSFTFVYRVSRFIRTSAGEIDCAVEGACTIGAGSLPNGRPGANTPILFSSGSAPPTPPSSVEAADAVTVTPAFTG